LNIEGSGMQAQMDESVRVRIGGIGISVCWNGSQVLDWPNPSFREFLTDGPCDVALKVHCGPLPSYPINELLFDARSNHWNLYRSNGQYLLEIFDTRTGRKNLLALLDQAFTFGEVHMTPDAMPEVEGRANGSFDIHSVPSWSLPILLHHLGELLVVNRLSRNRGLLVHAAGINDRGAGLLFVGPSGSGKSTLANLYRGRSGVTILGDERIIVSTVGRELFISGTPWAGDAMLTSAATAPLRRIFFLEHANANVLRAEKRSTLAALLCQQLFLPFWDQQGLACVLRLVDELLQTVPAYRLGFVNDLRVIEFLGEQVGDPPPSHSSQSPGVPWPSR
jgi:hypothetical protein